MDKACVVDTDVLSYLFRVDSRAEAYRLLLLDAVPFISFMTVAESERWALARGWGSARRQRLEEFLDQFSIVLVDRSLCRTWAAVIDGARRTGRPIQTADAWIAATARSFDLQALTNYRDDSLGVDGLLILPRTMP